MFTAVQYFYYHHIKGNWRRGETCWYLLVSQLKCILIIWPPTPIFFAKAERGKVNLRHKVLVIVMVIEISYAV